MSSPTAGSPSSPGEPPPAPVVNQRIQVYWSSKQRWFEGHIREVHTEIGKMSRITYSVVVAYDDGDVREHKLWRDSYKLGPLPDAPHAPPAAQVADAVATASAEAAPAPAAACTATAPTAAAATTTSAVAVAAPTTGSSPTTWTSTAPPSAAAESTVPHGSSASDSSITAKAAAMAAMGPPTPSMALGRGQAAAVLPPLAVQTSAAAGVASAVAASLSPRSPHASAVAVAIPAKPATPPGAAASSSSAWSCVRWVSAALRACGGARRPPLAPRALVAAGGKGAASS